MGTVRPPPAEIAQRVAALREIRSRAQEQLIQARKDLRSLIAPAQEPALVAMGYLDVCEVFFWRYAIPLFTVTYEPC